MTREEAIAILEEEAEYLYQDDEPYNRKALEMAIQALSQESTDTWSIKDVADTFKKHGLIREQEPCTVSVSEKESDEISEEISIKFFKNTLKLRWHDFVIYNVEWLKKNWQMEMDIVCGVKPCTDAVSRQAILDGIEELKQSPWATANRSHGYEYLITEALDVVKDLCVKQLPSVNPQPCDDAISREAVLDEIDDTNRRGGFGCKLSYTRCRGHVEQLPPVTQKSGKWQVVSDGYGDSAYICECSECKDTVWVYKNADRKWKYCPNCGAKMFEPQESEG